MAKTHPCPPLSDGKYTGPVPGNPHFKMIKTQILNSGTSQSDTPSQRAQIVMRCRGHLAGEGAGRGSVG